MAPVLVIFLRSKFKPMVRSAVYTPRAQHDAGMRYFCDDSDSRKAEIAISPRTRLVGPFG